MKFVKESCMILLFCLAGELCHALLPFPIPASIYGMVLLLAAFFLKLIKVEDVEKTGTGLVSLLPLFLIVPAVGILAHWELIRPNLLKIAILIIVTTCLTFVVSGLITKLIRKGGAQDE